jgi:hypothetical protein
VANVDCGEFLQSHDVDLHFRLVELATSITIVFKVTEVPGKVIVIFLYSMNAWRFNMSKRRPKPMRSAVPLTMSTSPIVLAYCSSPEWFNAFQMCFLVTQFLQVRLDMRATRCSRRLVVCLSVSIKNGLPRDIIFGSFVKIADRIQIMFVSEVETTICTAY